MALLSSSAATAAPVAGPLDGLRWLAGTWERDTVDSQSDETWSLPVGQMMLGMFRLVENGEVRFVELQTIRVEDDDIVLRILHASPELVPWAAEKGGALRYVALSLKPGEAVFGNTTDDVKQIIYRLTGPSQLLVRLVKIVRGETEHIDFHFRLRGSDESRATAVAGPDGRCRPRGGPRVVATDCCTPVPW